MGMEPRMNRTIAAFLTALFVAACGGGETSGENAAPAGTDAGEVGGLRTAAVFADIADEEERAAALFSEMFKVIGHPRCVNCHTPDEHPRQGDAMAIHQPPAVRGDAGFGMPGMNCNTCHGAENYAYATGEGSIPGHEVWLLAPVSMNWLGLSEAEVCAQMKDPQRNGGRTLKAIHEHNAEDGLVGWGWRPGEGREPVPGDQETFGDLTLAWIEAGAHCPS